MIVHKIEKDEFSISELNITAIGKPVLTFKEIQGTKQVNMNLEMKFEARDIGELDPLTYDCGVFKYIQYILDTGNIKVAFDGENVKVLLNLPTKAPKGRFGS